MLTDGDDECEAPTKENIRAAMSWLVRDAVPGDSLLFFFSGHGTQQPNFGDQEKDGFDEAIVPVDVNTNGVLARDHTMGVHRHGTREHI